ncbi:MAG: lysophospholipid acyltransferase family protein [Thiogranum sp.]|nr:lysophospholipid acyltransferase family protein [Thiogranum sp.]
MLRVCLKSLSVTRIHVSKKRRRPRALRAYGWFAEAAFVAAFWLLARCMPPRRAAATGRKLFRWLGPRTGKQRFVRGNLAQAFPNLDVAGLDTLCRDAWGNFGAVLAEYPHLRALGTDRADSTTDIWIDAQTRAVMANAQPAVYVTAHLANWELAGLAITAAGVPLSVVYAPQGNPLLDRMLQAARRSLGCRFVGKRHALRKLMRELRCGRSVGILSDQRVDSGAPVPFFGRSALTATTPAWLALKLRCPLIPVQIVRIGEARYRVLLHQPLACSDTAADADAVLQLTAQLNGLFESWIRQRPEQWLCMRRRWPSVSSPHLSPN